MSTPDIFAIPEKPIADYDGEDIVAYLTGVIAKLDAIDASKLTDEENRAMIRGILDDVRAIKPASDRVLATDPDKLAKTNLIFALIEVVAESALSGEKSG